MPNDFLSLWSPPRRSARIFEGNSELVHRAAAVACVVLSSLALPGCGGEQDDGVTYGKDIQPLFNRRCTTCHHPTSPIGVDIQNPFAPERQGELGPTWGLVNAPNSYDEVHPEDGMPARNVVPFEPENSFLIDKLTGDLPVDPGDGTGPHGGAEMPLQVEPLSQVDLDVLEQWVTDGAQPGAFFNNNVATIFGSEASPGAYYGGKCIFCHYDGSPNPLNLSDPFGPNGLVNVNATYRADMVRVLPGNPEQSLLILKVRALEPNSDYGAQMPYSYSPLTASQVATVRQWILEGARP
jgi:hypothetical protein